MPKSDPTDKWATQTSLGFDPHSREVPHYTTVSCRKPNEALERGTSQLTDDIECSEREEKPSCFNERTYSRPRDRWRESIGWSKEVERPIEGSSSMNTTDVIDKYSHASCEWRKPAQNYLEIHSRYFCSNAPSPKNCQTCGLSHQGCSRIARHKHLVCSTVPPRTSFCFLSSSAKWLGGR